MFCCYYCSWIVVMLFVFTDRNLSNTPRLAEKLQNIFQLTAYKLQFLSTTVLFKGILEACRSTVINQFLLLVVMFVSFGSHLKNIFNHTTQA